MVKKGFKSKKAKKGSKQPWKSKAGSFKMGTPMKANLPSLICLQMNANFPIFGNTTVREVQSFSSISVA